MRRRMNIAVGTQLAAALLMSVAMAGCPETATESDTSGDIGADCTGDGCGSSALVERCTNGVDDDEDGTTDCADEECATVEACEPGFEKSCDDGFDNDGDGISDCNDSDCNNVGTCGAWGEKLCGDGIDNDGDGTTDCADSDCATCGGQCCGDGFTCEADSCKIQCEATSGGRCGAADDVCCAANEACLSDACVVLGTDCSNDGDCELGVEVCEPVSGKCIPTGSTDICEYIPPVGVLSPTVGCRWSPPQGAENPTPGRDNVCMNPVVANLSDDNADGKTDTLDTPDIAFVAWDHSEGSCCDEEATLYVVSGKCNADGTMDTLASIATVDLDESGGLAVGDLDGDGIPEIVAMKLFSGTVAYKRATDDGKVWGVLWENDQYPVRDVHTRGGAQPSLADLDGDGTPEVIIGNVVLNGKTGALQWDGVVKSGGTGGIGNNAFLGPVSIVSDIDLDKSPDVIAGHTVYEADGTVKWTYSEPSSVGYCGGSLPCDGFAAVGNFDADDEGEVVLVRQGEIVVLEHDGAVKLVIPIPWDDCSAGGEVANESGPPTIADFDGDGRPEIGTAGADYYVVADLDCVGDPLPDGCFAENILWVKDNEDCSSRATASSVFDFEGDGRAEVIYADETSFRILDGKTGATLYEDLSHGSNTRLEMPVIADVDNDGNAEIIIPENENKDGTPGIEVWKDANNNWVRSRRIWNQHSYHISNVSEDGIVPAYEEPNWLGENPQNNFRQNVQPEGTFWAPDLQVSAIEVECGELELTVNACIANEGALAVPDGVNITAWISIGGGERELITTIMTTSGIAAQGECVPVQFSFVPPAQVTLGDPFTIEVEADVTPDGTPGYNECFEDNNTLEVSSICAS